MAHNRLGLMGHYYNGMLDIYSDLTAQVATFGGHMEIIDYDFDLDSLHSAANSKRPLSHPPGCPEYGMAADLHHSAGFKAELRLRLFSHN